MVRLSPKPWMVDLAVKKVLKALTAGGKEARFIGGCVRDELLNLPVTDVDIATPERPNKVLQLMKSANIDVFETGIKHGTVTAAVEGKTYQITSLRKDIKSDGRHAVVSFTDDWRKDALRRDFTINSLSATPEGIIYDYLDGLQDLSNHRIKFVGSAEKRIREDYLRILRYFRFMATTGFKNDDEAVHQTCLDNSHLLSNLSGERIRDELFKILVSENHNDTLGMMIRDGVTKQFLPEARDSNLIRNLIKVERYVTQKEHLIVNPIRRLASLIYNDVVDISALAKRLRISNKQFKHLKALLLPKWRATWNISDNDLRVGLYKLSPDHVIDLSLLQWSKMLKDSPSLPPKKTDAWLTIINKANQWESSSLPVNGKDVLRLGIEEGPRVSGFLQQVEDWWIKGGCKANRAKCLDRLTQVIVEKVAR